MERQPSATPALAVRAALRRARSGGVGLAVRGARPLRHAYAALRERAHVRQQLRSWSMAADRLPTVRHAVVVGAADAVPLVRQVRRRFAEADVCALLPPSVSATDVGPGVTLVPCRTMPERVDALLDLPDVDLLVEALPAKGEQRVRALMRLLPLVAPGGTYVVVKRGHGSHPGADGGLDAALGEISGLIDRAENTPVGQSPRGWLGLAAAVASVAQTEDVALLVKRGRHRLKLRDGSATEVLDRHRGTAWGRVHATTPEETFEPRLHIHQYNDGPRGYQDVPTLTVPARELREYRAVSMTARQRVYDDRFFLPDTFRHRTRLLGHRALSSVDAHTAQLVQVPDQEPRRLEGRYFYLDTEFPGHFGHVTTEVLGRVPGWRLARELAPDLRPIISLGPKKEEMPSFQRTLFEALDIPVDDVAYVRHGEVVEIESLWAQASAFCNPHFASPSLEPLWDEVASALAIPGHDGPRRLFVTRGVQGRRNCRSLPEVEQFFTDEGFVVVRPEQYPLAEQISMFRGAEVLAGFAGSAVFTTMFAGPQRRILIASGGYTARNEYLISAVRGGELHVFWGPPDTPQPDKGWVWEAFQSDFDFDVDANADRLRRVIGTDPG